MTKVNVVEMSATVGEMSVTVGEMSATVEKLNRLCSKKINTRDCHLQLCIYRLLLRIHGITCQTSISI